MLDHPDFIVAKSRIDAMTAAADRSRSRRRARRTARQGANPVGRRRPERPLGRTLGAALEEFGAAVGTAPAPTTRAVAAMRLFVADAVAIARDAGAGDVPPAPTGETPAVVVNRTAGVLAQRIAGAPIVLDAGSADQLDRLLALIRFTMATDVRAVPDAHAGSDAESAPAVPNARRLASRAA